MSPIHINQTRNFVCTSSMTCKYASHWKVLHQKSSELLEVKGCLESSLAYWTYALSLVQTVNSHFYCILQTELEVILRKGVCFYKSFITPEVSCFMVLLIKHRFCLFNKMNQQPFTAGLNSLPWKITGCTLESENTPMCVCVFVLFFTE